MSSAQTSETPTDTPDRAPSGRPAQAELYYRHRGVTRLTHWLNVLCVATLLLSGLQILNAHPALYWGQAGDDYGQAFVAFTATERHGVLEGHTRIGQLTFVTTGVLGASRGGDGALQARGVPSWATLPSFRDLATGRRWHFFFAWLFVFNGLAYLVFSLVTGHFKRDLALSRHDLRPAHVLQDLWDHARLRFPRGEAAKRYNVLQKAAYLGVMALLGIMGLTGLTMSPGIDAALPGLVDVFGGRQSARTVHFISASLIVAFIAVHLAMVVLAGPINEIRSMISGWYRVRPEEPR